MKKIIILPVAALIAALACTVLAGAASAGGPEPGNASDMPDSPVLTGAYGVASDGGEDSTDAFFGKSKVQLDLPDPSKYEGMTDEERKAAMLADLKAALDQKVASGEITQEQSDRMLERFSKCPDGGTCFKGGPDDGLKSLLPDPSKYEGMTDEERKAAMQADLKAVLDQKVASGEITQEQADRMMERFSKCPDGGTCFKGATDAELKSLLPDPSKYEGMTDEERKAAMQADLKAALDQKVAEGVITREQADRILEHFSNGMSRGPGARDGHRGPGRGGDSGENSGNGGTANDAPTMPGQTSNI